MLARVALASALFATTATAALADRPAGQSGSGLTMTPTSVQTVRRPNSSGYLIITMEEISR